MSCHFWPFTDVLGRIWRFVTRKVGKSLNRGCRQEWHSDEQKETKVAKSSRIRSDRNHLCFLRYLLLEEMRFGAVRLTHSCCTNNRWSDYFGGEEPMIFSKRRSPRSGPSATR